MIDAILGIDVSKNTLDVSISRCTKVRTKSFANSSDGWHHLLDWLTTEKIQRVHARLEATGRYSLGITYLQDWQRRSSRCTSQPMLPPVSKPAV